MSNKYSYINILKSEASSIAAKSGIKQTEALEQIARQSGFNNFHELQTVAKRNPREVRLMKAALGTDDFAEVVYQEDVMSILYDAVDEPLSSHVADTNALDFTIENLEVKDADFENKTGVLFLEIFFDYSGEQDPDRAHHGSVFHVFATLMLARRDGQWNLSEPYGLEIHDVERDVDRAYRLDDTARQRLVSEGNGA